MRRYVLTAGVGSKLDFRHLLQAVVAVRGHVEETRPNPDGPGRVVIFTVDHPIAGVPLIGAILRELVE
jgi:hypothetical protein